tara:strand:+ start:641 stop:1336 length:696 start_codon:yes stop_codon:yes gene_type:complete
MVSDINFLLVGNSRLHWAEFYNNQYSFSHTKKNEKIPTDFNLQKLIWASVGKSPSFFLNKENEIKTKDINLPNLPNYFGVDRALACVGGLNTVDNPLKKDLLIADCGTILSLTKIDSSGSVIGGQLAPGFLTQLRSMNACTKNLKVPKKYENPAQDFSIETEDAILKGVLNSLTELIKSAFNPINDILITCGGDSKLITEVLETKNTEIIYSPNLVMEGMIFQYKSQNKLL